jgi:acyl-CoA synthetase (AMP-forming)/AMP-acid ligase II
VNVVTLFQHQAAARPDAAAFIEGRGARRRVISFAALDAAGAAGAARLRAVGLRPGDTVLVLVPLSARLYEVLAAVFRAGLVAVVLDPGAGRDHIAAAIALSPPHAFIGSPKAHLLRLLHPPIRRIPVAFVTDGWVPVARRWAGPPARSSAAVEPRAYADPALLTFTSGSTGAPRGAIRSHGVLAAQHRALSAALGLEAGQIDLATLPVVVLANLASGVTTVLPDADLRRPGAVDAPRLLAQIRAERPTRSTASPAFFERLLDAAAPGDLDPFRRLDSGGAPVFPDLLRRLASAAPNAHVSGVYGSTEAEPIADLPASALRDEDLAAVQAGAGLPVGMPVPEVALRIVPDRWGTPLGPFDGPAWEAFALPRGAVGEIVVAGEHVIPGYVHGRGDEETKVAVDGRRWHRTGDAGRLDDDGRLWLLGRCAHAVEAPAGRVYPLQVEAAVRAGWGLRAAFLLHGGARTLVVEGEGGAAVADLREVLAWAGIERVEAVEALPTDRRHNAKIDVAALRRLLDAKRKTARP